MGEKEEKKKAKGGGAEKKKEGGGGGGEKAAAAAAGPTQVVLKVDMHCEGCAMKIKRAVKGLPGVEAVSTEIANNKLIVVGNADPLKIQERLESKTRKKVDLLTPVTKKESASKADPEPNTKAKPDQKEQKKAEVKPKPKTAVSNTLVLKIRLHCDGCIERIRKTILRYKGVESVNVDSQKDLVTVTGTMDAGSLVPYLKDKLKRSVDVVSAKKDDGNAGGGGEKKGNAGGGEKKEKGGGGGGDGDKKEKEKEKGGGGGDGEKKEKGKGKGDGGGDNNKEGGTGEKKKEKEMEGGGGEKKEAVAIETNKMEYHGTYGYGYGNGYKYGNGYHLEMAHAPQMFSDENPNACSIM